MLGGDRGWEPPTTNRHIVVAFIRTGAILRSMNPERIESLSKRQLECLRGVAALKRSKEIASELGISAGTVDNYIAEAVGHLGARSRREAALALAEHEEAAPGKSRVGTTGVVAPPVDAAPSPSPSAVVELSPATSWFQRLPLRREGQVENELRPAERLFWILAISVCMAIGLGMLMSGLQLAATLIERLWRLFG